MLNGDDIDLLPDIKNKSNKQFETDELDEYQDDEFDLDNEDELKQLIGESPAKRYRELTSKYHSVKLDVRTSKEDTNKYDDIDDLIEEELRNNEIEEPIQVRVEVKSHLTQ